MIKKFFTVLAAIGLLSNTFAQENVLVTINNEKITTDEFLRVYNKNNNQLNSIDPKTIEEYLELYVNFKLKVAEAESLGFDTVPSFVKELAGYRKQLAKPYLTDKDKVDELVKQAYDRMLTDVKASHILIRVAQDASPSDTVKAFKKIRSFAKNIKNPDTDFGKLAMEQSQDPSAKQNKGDLGYFKAFQMVYPFENAAYQTEVGKVSKPVRTRFGYHLLYVEDKRPTRGEILVSHILVKSESENEDEFLVAKKKIDELKVRSDNGEEFEMLARQHSDDNSSASKGGQLTWFGTGQMVIEFEDAAFSLKADGDISEPIRTKYGWHLIKRVEKKGTKSFEELEKELKRKVGRDGRSRTSQESFIVKLKKEYNYSYDESALIQIIKKVDDGFFEGDWTSEKTKGLNEKIAWYKDDKTSKKEFTISQQDFAKFLENNKRHERSEENLAQKETIVRNLFDKMVKDQLIELESNNLEAKYIDFKEIMQEYRDGILLFDLMDTKVWSKAVKDTLGLQSYHENNKTNFMWQKRVDAKIFVCTDEAIAKKAMKLSKKQSKKGFSNQVIFDKLNKESQLAVEIREDKYLAGDDPVIDKIEKKAGLSELMNIDNRFVFVNVNMILPPQPKTIDEARGLITAQYQDYLEKEWIAELRSKFSFQVNQKEIDRIK